MANTYTQLYIQIVFVVKGRENLISKNNREELHKYIAGIILNRGHKLLSVFCMPDHTHLLIGLKPSQSLSDLVRDVKAGSSAFITEKKWVLGKFSWQEGYGAFSYSRNQIDTVIKYIQQQEEHHCKKTFREEYLEFLNEFEIDYNEDYLFENCD
jgi:REP element-mobilizing transposase RayT